MAVISLEGYPPWLVDACSVLVAIFVIWVLLKVLKVALWLLLCFIVAGAAVAAFMHFFGSGGPVG